MKTLFWKAAVSCGLALFFSSDSFGAVGLLSGQESDPVSVRDGRGDHRGELPPVGVNGSRSPGGVHAPAFQGSRNRNTGRGPVAGPNRTPSLSNHRGALSNHRGGRESLRDSRGAAYSQGRRNEQQIRNARIIDYPFRGNTVHLNDHQYNIGNSRYQPSHYRHSGYHGYWNGNRRLNNTNNILNTIAYGLGASQSIGISGGRHSYYTHGFDNYDGYGSGWGWGLGSGYRGSQGYRSYSGYGYRPTGWGLGGWGLGSLNYSSGYLGYSNPYYVGGGTTVYNYTQPIPVFYNTPEVTDEADYRSADTVLTSAMEAFRLTDYDKALDITNKGISQYADDAVLHEFRALILFAKNDYQQAAATIHSVLAVGPGWDWTTLIGMYSNSNLYTDQLRTLEAFTRSNPQDAASQFLLGYHYMTCGHPDAAAASFRQVISLKPDDRVAADLLRMITPTDPPSESSNDRSEVPPDPAAQLADVDVRTVDPKVLVGTWSAQREDGSAFGLKLTDDATFAWKFTPKGQPAQEFGGTYTVEKNVLVLERKDGGSLIAEITPNASESFNFRLLGASDDDKGLEFTR